MYIYDAAILTMAVIGKKAFNFNKIMFAQIHECHIYDAAILTMAAISKKAFNFNKIMFAQIHKITWCPSIKVVTIKIVYKQEKEPSRGET